MPEGFTLSEQAVQRTKEAVEWVEAQSDYLDPMHPGRGPDHQDDQDRTIRVTSATPDPTNGYPALFVDSDGNSPPGYTDLGPCWARELNGGQLLTGRFHGRITGFGTDGKPLVDIDLLLAGGGAGGLDVIMGASGPGSHAGDCPDPGPSQGFVRFLREDATWQIPPGSAGGVSVASVDPGYQDVPITISPTTLLEIDLAGGLQLTYPGGTTALVSLQPATFAHAGGITLATQYLGAGKKCADSFLAAANPGSTTQGLILSSSAGTPNTGVVSLQGGNSTAQIRISDGFLGPTPDAGAFASAQGWFHCTQAFGIWDGSTRWDGVTNTFTVLDCSNGKSTQLQFLGGILVTYGATQLGQTKSVRVLADMQCVNGALQPTYTTLNFQNGVFIGAT